MPELKDRFTEQIIALWRICFPEDSEEFISFYFDRKYKKENTLVIRQDEKIVSALQILPYKMTFYDREIDTSYISGACTHPSLQSKGLMTQLLSDSFEEMRLRGISLTTLIPASERLFNYYRKTGYATVFDYSKEIYPVSSFLGKNLTTSKYSVIEWERGDVENIYPYFKRKEQERPFCIQHSKEEFLNILADLYLENGILYYVKNNFNHHICGLLLAIRDQDQIQVKEFFYDSESEKNLLLMTIAEKYNSAKEIVCTPPPHITPYYHLGMARVVDVGHLLSIYAETFPDRNFNLRITDPIIPHNSGIFSIKNGICNQIRGNGKEKILVELSIEQFTQAILGYQTESLPDEIKPFFQSFQPYMSLMIN